MKTHKTMSDGQALVNEIRVWLRSFVAMPDDYALVTALFAINSYVYKAFDSCPYLAIVAATKRAGKTTLLETVAALCKGGDVVQSITEPTLFAMIDASDGWTVPCLDEFELRDDDMGQTLNGGYRVTGKARRVNRAAASDPNAKKFLEFTTYCQKAFACIGDLPDTLRDRAIVLTMSRGNAERKYRYSTMQTESRAFVARIEAITATFPAAIEPYDVEWLTGRDEEVWMPLFSVARELDLDDRTMDQLVVASKRLTMGKSADALKHTQRQATEDAASDKSHSEQLLRDALKVCEAHETKVWTVTLIDRLHKREGWDTFRGTGLTPFNVSELFGTLGIQPKQIFIGTKANGKNRQGYDVTQLRAVAARVL